MPGQPIVAQQVIAMDLHIKKTILISILIACSSLLFVAAAEPVSQITWDDLVPAHLRSAGLLSDLDEDQRNPVYWVINMLENLPDRGPETEEYYQEIDDTMPTLKEAGIDITTVMAKRKEIRTAAVRELNGKTVRLPGYVLPLEMSGLKVTEFLLVPYVGACIHTPPPPPNQIVLVKTPANKGYKSKQLYEPVWVTGVVSVQSMVKDLYLVDGSADVDIGYTMQASHIGPYE